MLSAQIKAKQTKVGQQVAPMPSSWMHCIRFLYFWYKVSQPGLLKSPIYCFLSEVQFTMAQPKWTLNQCYICYCKFICFVLVIQDEVGDLWILKCTEYCFLLFFWLLFLNPVYPKFCLPTKVGKFGKLYPKIVNFHFDSQRKMGRTCKKTQGNAKLIHHNEKVVIAWLFEIVIQVF